MSEAYLIARVRVHDKERFETFKQMSTPLISEYGGCLLAHNHEVETLEGNHEGLVVLLEFDSMEEARQFYFSDGYTAAKLVREKKRLKRTSFLWKGFSSRRRRLTNFAGTAFNNIGFAH